MIEWFEYLVIAGVVLGSIFMYDVVKAFLFVRNQRKLLSQMKADMAVQNEALKETSKKAVSYAT